MLPNPKLFLSTAKAQKVLIFRVFEISDFFDIGALATLLWALDLSSLGLSAKKLLFHPLV